MQPQDGGDGFSWLHGISSLGSGAVGALLTWVWRAARIEPQMKLDIAAAEKRVGIEIQEAERRSEEKVEEMVNHFQEAFNGIRRQIDELAKDSLPREEFNTSRKENREDFGRLDTKLDRLLTEILARHK